jgi:hypothetical protein
MRNRRRSLDREAEISRLAKSSRSVLGERHGIDAFRLFCAYHLGITEDGGYRFQNIHHVARRFGTNAAVIRQVLADFRMDPDVIVQSDFDMADAQVDIMMAPQGVDRIELARELYDSFRAAPRRKRDWVKELERDARENEKIFGRKP